MSSIFSLLLLLAIIILSAYWVASFLKGKKSKFNALDYRVISVKIPRGELETSAGQDSGREWEREINLSEQLIGSLSAIKRPVVFEVAVRRDREEIDFVVAVPATFVDFTIRELHGHFPTASVLVESDYTIFFPSGSHAEAYLALDKPYVFPINTFREAGMDTFAPILSTFSKIKEKTEGAALQIIIEPADEGQHKLAMKAFEGIKQGLKAKDVVDGNLKISAGDVRKALFENKKDGEGSEDKKVDEDAIKAVQMKISKPLFYTNVRIVTSATDADRADDLMLSISNSFASFSSPHRNSFKVVKLNRLSEARRLVFDYIFREFNYEEKMILNAEELASVFHFPTKTTEIPRVNVVRAKEAAAPSGIPTEGVTIGQNIFRGESRDIKISDEDRRRHLYLIGQTGTGKSTMLLNMAIQDMKDGKGLCVIDPHGDLVQKILSFVPTDRAEDVIVFDPGDLARPLGLNMLEYDLAKPQEKTFIVNEMQSIFNQLFSKETMGPMFEKYMRGALLLLMEDAVNEPATLMEIPRVFTDPEYRERKLARITNPTVVDFWTKEAPKTSGEQGLANMGPYITSKFDNFISNDYLRPIIGQPKSAFNFRQVMDEGKILLVNLSKGKIGDINSALLGMIITGRLLLAALSREDMSAETRRDFYLYIDEFQNYTTDSIATILSEARKYRLNLVIAHQFIAQLKDNIREAVFGNVGNMVAFRVGDTDGEKLSKFFEPTFNQKDLIGIENLSAVAKVMVKGEPSVPFSLKFTWPKGGSDQLAEKIHELSRLSYGKDLNEIEIDIIKRLRS
ncbi:MAG: type IV secretion system DNA-binding domain-containing protein [Candidatus Paceibacterota bacterium]